MSRYFSYVILTEHQIDFTYLLLVNVTLLSTHYKMDCFRIKSIYCIMKKTVKNPKLSQEFFTSVF